MVAVRARDRHHWGVFDLNGGLVAAFKMEDKARRLITLRDDRLPTVGRADGSRVQDKTTMLTYRWITTDEIEALGPVYRKAAYYPVQP